MVKARFVKFIPVIVGVIVIGIALLTLRLSEFKHVQKVKELSPEVIAEIKQNESIHISDIIAMHQEDVESSRYVLGKTSDKEVKSFTEQRIKAGTESTWKLISRNQVLNGEQFPKTSTSQRRAPDLTLYSGKDLERVYFQAMMDIDRVVVSKSKALILVTQEDTLKWFASDLLIEKEKEIEKLKTLIEKYQK